MKILLPAVFFLLYGFVYSQVVKPPGQPPWLGLTASNKRLSNPFSAGINPAGLAFADTPLAGICSEIKYLQPDLRFVYGAVAWPLASGGAAVNIGFVGTEGYRQARIGLLYAKKLGKNLSLGIGFDYHRLSVSGYGSRNAMTATLGCQFGVTEKLGVFFATDNPLGGKLGKSTGEKLAAAYSAGLGNVISEKVFVSAILRKEEDRAAGIFFMIQYTLMERVNFFAGLSVGEAQVFFGSSILLGNLELKQAVDWKQGVGISPSLVVLFHKKKRE